MAKSFGTPGASAREQADIRRRKLERLAREEHSWEGGSLGEEGTAEAIEKRCPAAIALHDRRMPGSRANIDHIVLVPSGVWVVDSKRMKGRIKVEDAKDGTQKLLVDGRNRTELVHKLTSQVNAVRSVMTQVDPRVPVNGAFCFWLAIESTRDLFDPRVEDNGLPLLRTWTINGYPLFHPRQLTRRLNSAGTLTARRADEIAAILGSHFLPAVGDQLAAPSEPMQPANMSPDGPIVPAAPATPDAPPDACTSASLPPRMSKDEFKAAKEAEHHRAWEQQRGAVEDAIGRPVPPLLSERLPRDGAVWCHPGLWHTRVYLACLHDKVGDTFDYRKAASVLGPYHDGRAGMWQWRALTAFLEHLQAHGYVRLLPTPDGRIDEVVVLADLRHPPAR
jgi:hypothetical protein